MIADTIVLLLMASAWIALLCGVELVAVGYCRWRDRDREGR